MISREEALALGLKQFDGKPCGQGHDGKRYVLHGTCVKCGSANSKKWQAEKDKRRQVAREETQTRREAAKAAKAEAERRKEARLKRLESHYEWLASITKPPSERRLAYKCRCIDPASPEGQHIIHELYGRYPGLTALSSLAA